MTENSAQNSLFSLGQIFANIAVISFFISSVYDIGFYSELGLNITEVPTTFSDHARTFINWLPWLILICVCIFISEVVMKRLEDGLTEEEIIAQSKNPERTRKFRNSPYKPTLYLFIAVIIFSIFNYDLQRPYLPVAYGIIWMRICSWCFKHPRMSQIAPKGIVIGITILPAFCLFIWQNGKNTAWKQINDTQHSTTFILSDNSTFTGKTIRGLEKGFIVRDDEHNGTIRFLSNEYVFSMAMAQHQTK